MKQWTNRTRRAGLALGGVVALLALPLPAAQLTRAQTEFFESKIRPILANHCYKCHSAQTDRVKGGLFVDSREGLLKGGDTGPALVPGNPDRSLLIKAVLYTDPDLQMPPKGEKLSDTQISDLINWVKMGAPDPREAKPGAYAAADKAKSHWAFQPVRKPPVPSVSNRSAVANEIDSFIIAKLEEKDMRPSPQADKRTLIRRASLDLIGLPPTPKEVQDFLNDKSPDAYARLIDRLLASKQYGERWGRHWLDVARYSDTKGEINPRRGAPIYPYAWTYRDYVIKAFNDDKPYDRFILEQLAADLMPHGQDKSVLAALGFLTVGPRFDNNANEIINDRIDVITKAFQGLTVACARCHDHMFDPVPTKDYYSLHGILASSIEPKDLPILGQPEKNPEYQGYLREKAALEEEVLTTMRRAVNDLTSDFRKKATHYLTLIAAGNRLEGNARTDFMRKHQLSGDTQRTVASAIRNSISRKKGEVHPIMGAWHTLSAIPEKDFARLAPPMAADIAARNGQFKTLNSYVAFSFRNMKPKSMQDVAVVYGALFGQVERQWAAYMDHYDKQRKANPRTARMPTRLADANWELFRQFPVAVNSLEDAEPDAPAFRALPNALQGRVAAARNRLAQLELNHPGAPPRAMVVQDSPNPRDSYIFIRGEANNRGDLAPRRYLEIVSGPNARPFTQGSGRLELARAIASKDNPLTARVMVNRVWMHHFGEGFISSPDDVGVQAGEPTHPELLDYLAARFMEEGWSLKKLHRLIMLSNTYRQSSENNPRYAQIDPRNSLLWRANVRKLDFESLRDSLLHIGGSLDLTMGGKPVSLAAEPYSTRRSVYGYIDRANLPDLLSNFDFANPDMSTGKRYDTIVPQQALFLMNGPLVLDQAAKLTDRPDFKALRDDTARIHLLYELVYQRLPRPDEVKLGLAFVSESPKPDRPLASTAAPAPAAMAKGKAAPRAVPPRESKPLGAWEKYAHTLMLANEASFIN